MFQEGFLNTITSQFRLDLQGIHGIPHWERVKQFGLHLAESTKADVAVISHFAYLHDSQRQDELEDPGHGKRAADFVKKLYNTQNLQLTKKQLEQLQFACYFHNERKMFKLDDVTIQICWDADRLDLGRIGIKLNPEYLYTEKAKYFATNEEIQTSRRVLK